MTPVHHHRLQTLRSLLRCAVFCFAGACQLTDDSAGRFHGAEVTPAIAKPAFTLSTTDGRPFDFRAETAGRVVLLYFGYSNCPDICPVHLSNIEAALQTLPLDQRAQISVVFVTTDPARDTDLALRSWLDHFDRSFIGLRGDPDAVNRIAASVNVPASYREPGAGSDTTSYGVMHAAYVLAFSADDSLRVLYPSGVRQQDWAKDLPKLLAMKQTP